MNIEERYSNIFRWLFPSPLSIALILTLITFLFAFVFLKPSESTSLSYTLKLLSYWEKGLWSDGGLIFAIQMMLMLVLGHIVALSTFIDKLIHKLVSFCNSNVNAAVITTFFTVIISLINWGMGLIFGAILARKIGEYSIRKKLDLNYPLIGACGYVGLMVWHGGISGSAPIKIAEKDSIQNLIGESAYINLLPNNISFADTVFSSYNLITCAILLIILPLTAYFLAKRKYSFSKIKFELSEHKSQQETERKGAEKIDNSPYLNIIFGIIALSSVIMLFSNSNFSLSAINPNLINLSLFSLALLLHPSIYSLLKAIEDAIAGASGILIQFPLYFGILGIMQHSGLMKEISNLFINLSTNSSFNYLTFISAGIVNMFVPSGGGQWAVQGPIIIEAATAKGLPLGKSIMALAYGDQLTNMLQPFWALPLLGITKLKASQILPYTLIFMLVGFIVYSFTIFIL